MEPFPHIIHQTWKTADIPDHWKESSAQWKALHPTWTYHYTTDEDNRAYVEKHYPEYLATYDGLSYPIQRADMIRYVYLYDMGGVYSDLDIVPLRPLTEFVFDQSAQIYVCTSGNTPTVFTNSFMISKPKCDVWLKLLNHIKSYKKWGFTIRHLEIMNSTGPNAYTKIVTQHMDKVSILPSKLFMRFSSADTERLNCKEVALQEGAFNYPLVGNSWHAWDSALLHKISMNRSSIMLVVLVLLFAFACFMYYRSYRRTA